MQKMDDMDINQILEIPDTPDRLAAMQKPNWRSGPSVNLEESVRDSYSHCLRNSGLCNVAGSSSSNPEDDIDHLFRQANLARKISEVLDMKCCSPKTQARGTEAKPSVASCESGGGEKITNFSKKSLFPVSYSTQCRDSGRKNGNEPSTEHGSDSLVQTQEDFVFKDDHVFNERSEEIIDLSGKKSPSCLCYSTQCRDDCAIVRTQGKVFELIDLSSQRSPLSSSYPTQSTDLRRMNGKDPCSVSDGSSGPESGKADAFDRDYIASRHRDKGKKIDTRSNSRANMEPVQLIALQPNMSQGNMGKRRLVQNSCISPCNIGKRNTSAELDCENIIDSGETFSSFLGTSNQNKDKGIDSSNNVPSERSQACIRQSDCDAPPRSARQKRLVRNGCISPFNIVRSKNATKLKDVGTNGLKEFPDASSSRQLQILSPSAEGILADKRKGKVTLDGHLAAELQESIAKSSSERVCLTSGKDLTITKDINDNCLVFSENTEWRTARNRTGLNPSQGGSSSELERESSKHHGLRNQLKGKRKCSVLRFRAGENSSSSFEDSEISYLQSSRQHSSSNSTENTNAWPNRGRLAPIIEVDELLSPAGRYSSPERQSYRLSDESSARSKQVESDEMLARQLQEEFYLELGGVGSSEEIDANVAWSLQHQEDAQHAASFAMRSPSHSGHASVAHSYADPFPASLFQNSFATSTARAQVPARNRLAQLRRQFISNEIDPETRFDFLEAFEAVFDSTNNRPISSVFQVQHDFNVDDYEMLLSLDDNNHQHSGASDHQINSLPQSVVQSDSNVEPCAVCLENPAVGDVVRHLPCLHKFHKECIDIWLRRKTSCPICKSGIT